MFELYSSSDLERRQISCSTFDHGVASAGPNRSGAMRARSISGKRRIFTRLSVSRLRADRDLMVSEALDDHIIWYPKPKRQGCFCFVYNVVAGGIFCVGDIYEATRGHSPVLRHYPETKLANRRRRGRGQWRLHTGKDINPTGSRPDRLIAGFLEGLVNDRMNRPEIGRAHVLTPV